MTQPTDVDRAPIERITAPLVAFARFPLGGAILLIAATVVALVWANSPWAAAYHSLFETPVKLVVEGLFEIDMHLSHWINDALMGIFFFVVGLEIKREALEGELSSLRKAALPIAAAIGGMVVPALAYAVFNYGHPGAHGWGIPMATDIAFALGVLMLLGSRVPIGIKVFLTALAIVDDLGAIAVIAIFYTEHIAVWALIAGGALLSVSMLLNILGVRSALTYFVIGMFVWFFFLKSGVHATLAAVLMAFTIPGRTRIDGHKFVGKMKALLISFHATGEQPSLKMLTGVQQEILEDINLAVEHVTAPLQRLEHALAPVATFFVLPVFALANAGIGLSGNIGHALTDRVALGVIAGLLVGKQIGIVLASWLTVKFKLAELPSNTAWRHVHGASLLAGIGFTMSIFITMLAFNDAEMRETAKIGILVGSIVSGVLGYTLLRMTKTKTPETQTEPVSTP